MMSSNQRSNPPSSSSLIYLTILVVVGLWTYRNSLLAAFVLDDIPCIVLNRGLEEWQIAGPLVPYGMVRRPIGQLSLAINTHTLGRGPIAIHAVNVLIHLAAGLTLYGLVRRVLELPGIAVRLAESSRFLAFAIALLWLVHPLNTQAVTYAVQRIESQMALCYLLCLYAILRGSQTSRPWPWYALSITAFAIGVGTKEVIVTAIVVAPLFDRTYLASSWRQVMRSRGVVYASFVIGAVAWGAFAVWTQNQHHEEPQFGDDYVASRWEYLRTQPEVILYYFRLALWPDILCLDYWWPISTSPSAIYGYGALVGILVLAAVAGMFLTPRVAFPALAGFLILAPSSSIVPLPDPAVEYRMYLSLACFGALVVLGIDQIVDRLLASPVHRDSVRFLLLSLAVIGLSFRTNTRNRDYHDPSALWKQTADLAPHNPRAHYNAARHMEQEVERKPELEKKHQTEVLARYRQAVAAKPDYILARAGLAGALGRSGQYDAAIAEFEAAVRLAPRRAQTLDNYGNLFARQDKWAEAIPLFKKAIEVNRGYMPAYLHLGTALDRSGKSSEAAAVFREALKLEPRLSIVARELAWLLATSQSERARNGAEAVRWAESLDPSANGNDFRTPDIQAAAYAENGQFDEAIAAAEQARDRAAAAGQMKTADEVGERLALYRSHKPYRQKRPQNAENRPKTAGPETITPSGT